MLSVYYSTEINVLYLTVLSESRQHITDKMSIKVLQHVDCNQLSCP